MAVKPAKTALSRVFLIDGSARADHAPLYESCARMLAVSQGFGDATKIECPDPTQYGKFLEVGSTRGAEERPTTSIEGRYMSDTVSDLLRIAKKRCSVDIQLHMGECQDASNFNQFSKSVILEDAIVTNWETGELGALASGDDAVINETAAISAREVYEILPISYASKAGATITNEIVGVVICDTPSCGACTKESDGCNAIFAISKSAGGSPTTPADVLYSIDGGTTWYAYDISTLGNTEDPTGVACVGQYLVVISNTSNSYHYAALSDFDGGITVPTWTEVSTGFVVTGEPNAISSYGSGAFIVGDMGYIYRLSTVGDAVVALDTGTATTGVLNAVHALDANFAVAVGNGGAIVVTQDGTNWALATHTPVGVGVNLLAVFVVNENVWWVGTSTGRLYSTVNGGTSWTEKAFYQSGSGSVLDIKFPKRSVGYLSVQTSGTKGRILRSFDGGYSWTVTPEASGSIPVADKYDKLAVCQYDPNFVVAGGLADNGTDGILIVGSA